MNNAAKSFVHGLVSFFLFAIPMVLASHSPLLDLTAGGALMWLYHYLLTKFN